MSSQKQIDANRRNALKSTGPRTPEGRAAVRLNGLTHGLTAATLVLAGESQPDFESLLASFEAEHDPATPTEVALVAQLAMAAWRLRRGYHVEASYLSKKLKDTAGFAKQDSTASERTAIAFQHNFEAINNFSRYESRLERSFHKALRELQRLRALRITEMENQTQFADPGPVDPPTSAPEIRNTQSPTPITHNPPLVLPPSNPPATPPPHSSDSPNPRTDSHAS